MSRLSELLKRYPKAGKVEAEERPKGGMVRVDVPRDAWDVHPGMRCDLTFIPTDGEVDRDGVPRASLRELPWYHCDGVMRVEVSRMSDDAKILRLQVARWRGRKVAIVMMERA